MIIADITRAFMGTEYGLVQQALTRSLGAGTQLALVFFEAQRARIPHIPNARLLPIGGGLMPDQIADVIRRDLILPSVGSNGASEIEVFSFHPAVQHMVSTLPNDAGLRVRAVAWRQLTALSASAAAHFPADVLDRAVEVLVRALQPYPRGLLQTGIRDVIVGLAPELDKKNGGPPVGQIVRHAISKGLVEANPLGHVNPSVRLISNAAPSSDYPDRWKEPQGRVAPLPGSSEHTANDVREPAPFAVLKPPGANTGDQSSLPPVAGSTSGSDASGSPAEPRIKVFYAAWRTRELGPFSRERDALFDIIERLVADGPITAGRIVRKAPHEFARTADKPAPKPVLERFLATVLGRTGAFLDEKGEPLDPKSPASFGRPVKQLAPDWRGRVESELVRALIQSVSNITSVDLPTIAYALFPLSSEDERLDRTEALIKGLVDAGVVTYGDGRFISR